VTFPDKHKVGIFLAALYILLQPLMLQNPLKPVLSHGLGSLQIADALFPFMLVWMVWWLLDVVHSGSLRAKMLDHSTIFVAAGLLVVAFLLGGVGAGYSPRLLDLAKFGYLVGVLIFFALALNSTSAVETVFRILVCGSIGFMMISIGYYFAAILFGYSSDFAQIREGFPYLGRVVRLNGPMQPTSKLFGMYLLVLSLLLMLGKSLITPWLWRLAVILTIVCGLLTLGRAGVVAAAAVMFGVASYSPNRLKWISLMAIPMLMAALAIQMLTVWHIDIANLGLDCSAGYAIVKQSQYFGWYGDPTMCHLSLDAGVTYSSYFLMKLVALKAWLSQPLFGIGIYQYEHAWIAAAGVDIQNYFKDYPFTMAQSTYLTLLAEVGLFGFVAWFGLIGLFLHRIWAGLSQIRPMRWMFLSWCACFFYALIDLDVQNFRFLYSLIPLAAGLSITMVFHNTSTKPVSDRK
jgi:hypothetical protein